ncbi:hypothetical protein R5W23_005230 [Gemmata sp. JC673]|uniref:Uncharacterized protein n=1 Tax=Gemmata algarum TaxID=2975278 RepID=A0ABU5F8T3_9BACT|nr:hypothetical protein [Gemmata algarum]MDY3563614.1 hypothetical protein [Gemmata algarum]
MNSRFVVRRLNWRPAGEHFIRLPGEVRLGAFDTFDAASADRHTREAEVRGRVNPFKCGTAWHALTVMPEPVFRDWVRDVGLEPPPANTLAGWLAWWDGTQHARTAEQTERVWDGLTRVRFFDTVERPAGEVAFAVVRVTWEYNDAWYEPSAEGGRTVKAFRSRARAEAERERLEAEARRQWDNRHWVQAVRWELADWPSLGDRVGTDSEKAFDRLGVRLYEVIEVDLGEGT